MKSEVILNFKELSHMKTCHDLIRNIPTNQSNLSLRKMLTNIK